MPNKKSSTQKKYLYRFIRAFILLCCFLCCSCESLSVFKVSGSYQSNDVSFANSLNTVKIQYSTEHKGTKIIFSSQIVSELYSVSKLKPQTVLNSVEIYFW